MTHEEIADNDALAIFATWVVKNRMDFIISLCFSPVTTVGWGWGWSMVKKI